MGIPLTFGAAGMFLLLALLPDVGHDQLWLLLAAARIGPHTDPYGPLVFESNPPLALWLSALIVALAHALHLSLTVTFKLAVTLLVASSALLCAQLLNLLNFFPTPNSRMPHLRQLSRLRWGSTKSAQPKVEENKACSASLLDRPLADRWLLAFVFLLIAGVLPARDFGQRDHVLVFLVLPYLLAAAAHLARKPHSLPQRIVLTLLAALGLALKPHQALLPIAVELTLWLTSRPRRPRLLEPSLLLASALLYLLAIRALAPTYFTEVLPALRSTYWAFGSLSPSQLLHASLQLQLLLAATLITIFVARDRSPTALLFIAAGIAADLAYALQGTGWYYQQLPAFSFLTLAIAAQLLHPPSVVLLKGNLRLAHAGTLPKAPDRTAPTLPRHSQPRSWTFLATLALAVLALVLTFHFSAFNLNPNRSFPSSLEQPQPVPDPAFFRDLTAGTPVATLTTSVDDTVLPAFRHHLVLAQRYPHLWLLPAILRNESGPPPPHRIPPARLQQLDLQQHRFLVEDLTRWHPTLLLVERCEDPAIHCQVLEDRHDNLLAFFLRDPAFARIFARYRFVRSSGPYDAYVLPSDQSLSSPKKR